MSFISNKTTREFYNYILKKIKYFMFRIFKTPNFEFEPFNNILTVIQYMMLIVTT